MKVLVIAGGFSDEREVSLRSGAAVHAALLSAGHDAELYDLATELDTDTVQGFDVVFPALHGIYGEDGGIQKVLESSGVPFVGSDSAASRLCFDKFRYKQLLSNNTIRLARGELIEPGVLYDHPLTRQPFVLKPNDGGSSVDTFIIRDAEQANFEAMEAALKKHSRMLLEELIEGIEITVGVLDDQALPVIEIIPPANGEFDYTNKYNGKTQELCPSKHLSLEQQSQAQKLAMDIHKLAGCRDLSRTDMMVSSNQIVVLETNTMPGMTDQSLLPKAAATAGITMPELCDKLVHAAATRRQIENA